VIAHLRRHLETSVALRVKDLATGLLNGIGLRERLVAELARAVRAGKPISAVVLKVRGAVQAAHAVGDDETDAVIKPLADELTKQVRRCDIAARLDGDDMLAVLPETDAIGVDGFCRRASARLALAAERAGHSVSFATVTCVKPSADADVFLKIIDSRRSDDAQGHIDT
jgi:diguanylate cyclase (GGDEF)-like protein